jgi:hypothetical protein
MAFADLAYTWHKRLRDAQIGHFQSAVLCEHRHLWLGIPTVALSAIVGSSVFATMEKGASQEAKWLIGSLSVLAAIMTAVQMFLRHSDRAEKHRVAGANFGALKTELELRLQYPPAPEKEEEYVCHFVERWSRLIESSPTVDKVAFQRQKAAPPFDVTKLIALEPKAKQTSEPAVILGSAYEEAPRQLDPRITITHDTERPADAKPARGDA